MKPVSSNLEHLRRELQTAKRVDYNEVLRIVYILDDLAKHLPAAYVEAPTRRERAEILLMGWRCLRALRRCTLLARTIATELGHPDHNPNARDRMSFYSYNYELTTAPLRGPNAAYEPDRQPRQPISKTMKATPT